MSSASSVEGGFASVEGTEIRLISTCITRMLREAWRRD
jgi:hypothetical protein